ncbi:MAG: hypothetical protein ABI113_03750, partial [Mucilaginibacter sp.]
MKKIYYLAFAVLLAIACKKEHTTNFSTGTILRISGQTTGVTGQTIYVNKYPAQDSITVAGLMKANNLAIDGFVFYEYQSYNALDQNNQMGFYQIAGAMQVRNGLPVFFENIFFGFENGKLNGPYPAPQFIVGNIALDNKPNLALQTLRDKFIKVDNASEAHNISIGDSTLVAQLGYYNLNINHMAEGGAPDYIKAWYVHPQHSSWPKGYFRDDNGATISFNPLTHSGPINP